jgi:protein arginine N-methyltransferase 1
MYSLISYAAMLADQGRTSAYARALEARITPGAVVLDIGTGPGIMALLACRFGAARVYAVEPDDVIQVAREAAAASGFGDRVRFVQAMTTEIDLPEQVDGIVAEIHGALPLYEKSVVSILDARARFLKPGGWIIPARESLWAALVSCPAAHELMTDGWTNEHGFDFSGARQRITNLWRPLRLEADALLVHPRCWATLDYATLQTAEVRGEVSWHVEGDAIGHGVGVWFDTEAAPGSCFSNAPGSEKHVFAQGFFPWPEATRLTRGDEVRVSLRADFDGHGYVWSWQTRVIGGDGTAGADYRQSTFLAQCFGAERLRKRANAFVPQLSEDARIDRRILDLFARGLPLGEAARTIQREFPLRLATFEAAFTRAADLSERYSK